MGQIHQRWRRPRCDQRPAPSTTLVRPPVSAFPFCGGGCCAAIPGSGAGMVFNAEGGARAPASCSCSRAWCISRFSIRGSFSASRFPSNLFLEFLTVVKSMWMIVQDRGCISVHLEFFAGGFFFKTCAITGPDRSACLRPASDGAGQNHPSSLSSWRRMRVRRRR